MEPLGGELLVGGGDELGPCIGFPLLAVVGRAWKPFILMVNTFLQICCQFLGITIFTLRALCKGLKAITLMPPLFKEPGPGDVLLHHKYKSFHPISRITWILVRLYLHDPKEQQVTNSPPGP